jgi:hypothetical protein
MRHRQECPGPTDRHPVFDERQAYEWMCQHQLQLGLQTVAETIDHRAEALTAFQNAMCAAAYCRREYGK